MVSSHVPSSAGVCGGDGGGAAAGGGGGGNFGLLMMMVRMIMMVMVIMMMDAGLDAAVFSLKHVHGGRSLACRWWASGKKTRDLCVLFFVLTRGKHPFARSYYEATTLPILRGSFGPWRVLQAFGTHCWTPSDRSRFRQLPRAALFAGHWVRTRQHHHRESACPTLPTKTQPFSGLLALPYPDQPRKPALNSFRNSTTCPR